MAKKIICPNVNHESFLNLHNRLGDINLAYYIWNKTNGNVSNNGLPFISDFEKLNENIKKLILKSLSEEDLDSAYNNMKNQEDLSYKYSPDQSNNRPKKDFSSRIKTSNGETLNLTEKRAGVDSILVGVTAAFIENRSPNLLEIFNKAKENISALKETILQRKLSLSNKKNKTEDDSRLIDRYDSAIRSYDRILDPMAWQSLQKEAVNSLELNGIRIRSKNKKKLRSSPNIDLNSENADLENLNLEETEKNDITERTFDADDSLGKDPKDFSATSIKAMFMGLLDYGKNNLGVSQLLDQSYVYKQVLMTLTSGTDNTFDGMKQLILNESKRHPADNLFDQVYNIMDNSSVQRKIQFEVSLNKIRNNFVQISFNELDASKTNVGDANSGNVGKVVARIWNSDITNSLDIISSRLDENPDRIISYINDLGNEFIDNAKDVSLKKSKDDKYSNIESLAKTMMNQLGVEISNDTFNALKDGDKELYSTKNGYNLSARSFDKAHTKSGVFGSIATIMSEFNKSSIENLSAESVVDKFIDDLNQTSFRFLSGIEGKNSNRYFSNSFAGVKTSGSNGMRYNYNQPTPNDNLFKKLLNNESFRNSIANSIGLRKLSMFGKDGFGSENFNRIFSYEENYGLKSFGSNNGKTRNDLNEVDLTFSALQAFQSGGEKYTRILDTTKSDKKKSPSFKVPRKEFEVTYTIEAERNKIALTDFISYDNGNLIISPRAKARIMQSDLMHDSMSVIAAEIDRMIFAVTNKDNSNTTTYKNKAKELERIFGKNYIYNSQFFYSMASLNSLIDRNADGTISEKGLKKLDLSNSTNEILFKEALYKNFIESISTDISSWKANGLVVAGKGKMFTNLINYKWGVSKGYAPFITKKSKTNATVNEDEIEFDESQIDESQLDDASGEAANQLVKKSELISDEDYSYLSKILNIPENDIKLLNPFRTLQLLENSGANTKQSRKISMALKTLSGNTAFNDEMLRVLSVLSIESNMNTFSVMGNMGIIASSDPATSQQSLESKVSAVKKVLKEMNVADVNGLSINLAIDSFMNEYQKRLSADISPATDVVSTYEIKLKNGLVITGKQNYKVSFIEDALTDGEKYLSSLPEKFQKQIKQYTGKGTDGMEYVSFYNKLESLFRSGRINEKDFILMRRQYQADGTVADKYIGKLFIGAGKPRQVAHLVKSIGAESVVSKVFIKSAEIPLLAQFTKSINEDLDNLRAAMEVGYNEDPSKDIHISRIVHASAVKQGLQTPAKIYGKQSNFVTGSTVQSIYEKISQSSEELPWSSFGYQQETPTHFGDEYITNVVQADKSILGGLYDKVFNFKDFNGSNAISGENLDNIKHAINIELSKRAKANIDARLKIDGKYDIDSIVDRSIKADSGVSNNEAHSLVSVNKSGLPLLWSHGRKLIEQFLFSANGDAIKLDRPGRANPQFSLVGGGKVKVMSSKAGNDVVWLNGRDASKPLGYTTVKTMENGELVTTATAEIIVPFDFVSMGGKLSIEDVNKIDPELLKIIGMRLPNQLHQSQVLFQIVGFSPKLMGTVCFVPQEIVTQTGADFDIDKLYQYWRNSFLTKDNRLVGTPSNLISYTEDGDIIINNDNVNSFINDNFEDENKPDFNTVVEKALQNDYIQIFESVLSHPEVAQSALEALDAPDLKNTGNKYFSINPKSPWYSIARQNEEYRLQQSANSGIDIYAKLMSSVILADRKDIKFDPKKSIKKLRAPGGSNGLELHLINPYSTSTIGDEERTSLRNIVILLSESIDNAKNGNLIPNGLNDLTFNIAATLMILSDDQNNSLSLEYVPAILNQEIVKMSSKIESNSKGIISEIKNIEIGQSVLRAKQKLADKLGVKLSDAQSISDKMKSLNYDESELFEIYNLGQKLLGNVDALYDEKLEYLTKQIDIIDNIFMPLSKMSKKIFALNNNTSFDREFKTSSIANSKLLESINHGNNNLGLANSQKYTQTLNGRLNTTGNNLATAKGVVNEIDSVMGYDDPAIKSIISKLSAYNKMNSNDYSNFVSSAIDGYKTYIFTKVVTEEYGVKANINQLGKYLARDVRLLQKNNKYKNNKFIRSISINKSNTHISFNADMINNADMEAAIDGFYDMAKSQDEKIRKIAQGIIFYELLTNGNKTRSGFIKIIPTDILNDIEFYNKLAKKVNENNSDASVNEFINLFYRNNPQYQHEINSFVSNQDVKFKSMPSNFNDKIGKYIVSVGPKFSLANIPLFIKSSEKSKHNNIYVYSGYAKDGGSYVAYYTKSDHSILRGSAKIMAENKLKQSGKLFDNSFFSDYVSDNISKEYYIGGTTDIDSFSEDFTIAKTFFLKMLSEQSNIRSLVPIIRQIGTTYSDWMSAIIDKLSDKIGDINVIHSDEIKESGDIAEFNITKGKKQIIIYTKMLSKMTDQTGSIDFAKETLLHEIHHAIMVESYNLGKSGDKQFAEIANSVDKIFSDATDAVSELPIVNPVNGSILEYEGNQLIYGTFVKKGKIKYKLKSGKSTNSISEIAADLYGSDEDAKAELKRSLYMFISPEEFISELSSRQHIQELMNNVYLKDETYKELKVKKNKSLLETLFSKFSSFFDSIVKFFNGDSVNSKSILEAAMLQNMLLTSELMDTRDSKKKDIIKKDISSKYQSIEENNSQGLSGTVRDFLGKASQIERESFRYALNHNIFKTKCS